MTHRKIKKILVTGAVGQIGSELTLELRRRYGAENVVACGRKTKPTKELRDSGPFEWVDVTEVEKMRDACRRHEIDAIINMAAILSATGEKNPQLAWHVNVTGLINTLELARESLAKGAFDFIAKPFKLGEIRKTIAKAISAVDGETAAAPAERG